MRGKGFSDKPGETHFLERELKKVVADGQVEKKLSSRKVSRKNVEVYIEMWRLPYHRRDWR